MGSVVGHQSTMSGDAQSILDLINKRFDSIESSRVEKISAEVADNVNTKISASVDSKISDAIEPLVNEQKNFKEKTDAQINSLETEVKKLNSLFNQSSSSVTSKRYSAAVSYPKVIDCFD